MKLTWRVHASIERREVPRSTPSAQDAFQIINEIERGTDVVGPALLQLEWRVGGRNLSTAIASGQPVEKKGGYSASPSASSSTHAEVPELYHPVLVYFLLVGGLGSCSAVRGWRAGFGLCVGSHGGLDVEPLAGPGGAELASV